MKKEEIYLRKKIRENYSVPENFYLQHFDYLNAEKVLSWLKEYASQAKPVTDIVNNCDKPYGYLVNGRFVLFADFVGKTFDSTDSIMPLFLQSKPESVANIGEISDNNTTIKSVTLCPTCGSECEIGSGDSGSHYYIPNRIKPVDTKTVDAIDPTFWRRLEMFVSNIQVNDMAGEEEKQYIIHVIESKK